MYRGRRGLRRRAAANARYLWALLKRFKITFLLLAIVLLGGSVILWLGHGGRGEPLSFAKAMAATYFLLLGEPALELPDTWLLASFEALLPLFGLVVVADGIVRFGYLFFAKHHNDKEWLAVLAHTLKDHVVVCGAGRVGYRVLEQLRRMEMDVVVVERNENAAFVQTIRNLGIPLLVDDVRASNALDATNIRQARAIVCATDDDLANLNIALDARRLNPGIRVVMRLFDDDLVRKVRDAFSVEALSTSALAAPVFAAAALDASIHTSFDLDGKLMVVGEACVGKELAGKTVAQVRDEGHSVILKLGRGGSPMADAKSTEVLIEGDKVLVQASLEGYQRMRKMAGARASA